MRKSLLPAAGENKFQRIKRLCADAVAKGVKLIKLSIGQPEGPAIDVARQAAAEAVLSDKESMHEYQDNGSPGVPDFARRFVRAHVKANLLVPTDVLAFLPIPGIKPMLGPVIESLGSYLRNRAVGPSMVCTMTNPGYPTPVDQCEMIQGINHRHLPLDPLKGFLFSELDLCGLNLQVYDLVMLNLPHNPTGIVGNKDWLMEICEYCSETGTRLFNDAAYAILSHTEEATTLTDVAVNFPDLSWAEAFSASKAGNMTGWCIGAMVGSPDFIGDIARIKGNTDSGFAAPMAAGVLSLFENARYKIADYQRRYESRLKMLIDTLQGEGMKLAVQPEAGFFALFQCPKEAFGQSIEDSNQFNQLMINQAPYGVVGVDFDQYIRYAICACPLEDRIEDIRLAFRQAEVKY